MIFPLKSSMIFPVQFPVGKWHFIPSPPHLQQPGESMVDIGDLHIFGTKKIQAI
jgi:hypothetical protein